MSGRRVSRRGAAAGGLAMLVLAAVSARSAKADGLDGKLLALVREYGETEIPLTQLVDELDDLPIGDPRDADLDARFKTILARRRELAEEVADTQSLTPEGLKAKAGVALYELRGLDSESNTPNVDVAISLIMDILEGPG